MNFTFRSYPAHAWISGWTLEARNCTSAFRKNNGGQFFRTGDTVGRITPDTEEPAAWALQIPVPQNSRTNILSNGFCAYLTARKKKYGAEVFVPEAGVLWGRSEGIPEAQLASDAPIEEGDGFLWIESDSDPALLAFKGSTFCLITKTPIKTDALALADSYFDRDIEEFLQQELERRAGTADLLEDMARHDSLAVICAENMAKALRPPEGSIPLTWSQSSSTGTAEFDINELHPLALAWRLLDINVAEELVLCALRIQTNAGAIPVRLAPHAVHSVIEAPKPLLAKTAEAVWSVRKDPDFLDAIIPPLRRHIQWLLHHFDPKNRGMHCWKHRNESLDPDRYESDMATVDLTVLLVTEIEALNRLRSHSPQHGRGEDYFHAEHDALEHNLLGQFWNDGDKAFTNAFVRDAIVPHRGFSSFIPLLWPKLPNIQKSAILEGVKESGTLPGGLSVLSWRKSALDDNSFPLLQQLLVFHALKTADPHGMLLNDFSRITLQGFVEWHTLSMEKDNAVSINPVMAAYIVNVQSNHQYRYHGKGKITGYFFKTLRKARADRFDLMVMLATLFSLYSVHTVYNIRKAPPPLDMLESEMNNAYTNRDAKQVMENCIRIIQHYPDEAGRAKLLAGNISLLQEDYPAAIELLSDLRKSYPDSPGPMIALGLACQLDGRFKEAEASYYEFCYLFDEIFPDLVQQVNHFRYLMQEGFRAPPKWAEIYRYQLMHEL